MSTEKRLKRASLLTEERRTMNRFAGNGLTFEELEKIEEAAHRSPTIEAKSVLRLAAALREALQLKECAVFTRSKDSSDLRFG